MRKMRIIAGFLVFLAAGLLFGVLTKTPTARIEIVPETVDLGKVGTGRLYSGTFVLGSKGRAPLEVELQKVSCSCTVTEMCESPIGPKKKGTITAYITASESEGPFGSTITLRTNDPRRPEVVLKIRGIAETVMKAVPPSLLFGDIAAESLPQTKTLVVRPGKLATPNMLARLKADCKNECFQVETNRSGEEASVLVTLCKEAPIGAVRSSIVLSVDEFDNYEISVPVIACVTGDYEVRPTCLFYGRVAPGATTMRECHVRRLDNAETLELVGSPRSRRDSLDVNVEYAEGEAIVKVVLQAGLKAGTYEDVLKLRLKPKDGGQPQYFQIPIIYVVGH
jgi:hypothetical protein